MSPFLLNCRTIVGLLSFQFQERAGTFVLFSVLFRKMISNLKPYFSWRCERSSKGTFEGFSKCGSWVKLLGMRKIGEKLIFQRSGAKICVKHQMSFWGSLEGWAKRASWVILKKSQKIALVELKQDENAF